MQVKSTSTSDNDNAATQRYFPAFDLSQTWNFDFLK